MRVLLSVLLSAPVFVFAQNIAGFDDVCALLGGHDYVAGDFIQTKTNPKSNHALVSSGVIIISKHDGIVIRTEKPVFTQVFCGIDFMIQTGRDGKKQKLDAKGNESFRSVSNMFNALFSGDPEFLKQRYTITFEKENAVWECGIMPKTSAFFKRVVIQGTSALRAMRFDMINGDTLWYELSNIQYPERLSEDEKTFFQ